MIYIDLTPAGLHIRRGDIALDITAAAVPLALGPVIHELIDTGRALAAARLEAYNRGLADGHDHERIEAETRARCEQQRNADALAELIEASGAALAA